MFFLYSSMSLAEISQFSMASLDEELFTFIFADSSADCALVLDWRNVEVGEDDTDLDDFEGLLLLLLSTL